MNTLNTANPVMSLMLAVWEDTIAQDCNTEVENSKEATMLAGRAVANILVTLYSDDKYKLLGQLWETCSQFRNGLNSSAEAWAKYVTEQVNRQLLELADKAY